MTLPAAGDGGGAGGGGGGGGSGSGAADGVGPGEAGGRLWGGRFAVATAPPLDRLNRSLPIDRRLWAEDVAGSRAWVAALRGAGVLTETESATLDAGLAAVAERLASWGAGEWATAPDEDIHSLVERLLGEEVGPVAGKLHTGRSRNDQVATDGRLWAMGAADRLAAELAGVAEALMDQASRHGDTLMPAYTHFQRAQPVTAAHWLLSHVWPLLRDRDRLWDARRRAAVLPLGSGAIAGCPFPVDREALKEALGFEAVSPNSMDAVGDRDWAADLLYAMTMVAVHLSRLAEELVVFGTAEFGFVRFADAWSTGSSLMPQKRNPDGLELARAGAGRILGELVGLVAVLKGLPGGYSKDLQEDKRALFDAFDHLLALLPAVAGTVATLEVDPARCRAALDDAMLATDLADALVAAGTPFRVAHEEVGRVVRAAEAAGCALSALDDDAIRAASPAVAALDWRAALDAAAAVRRKAGTGGTAPAAVAAQLDAARRAFADGAG